jgi:hypothetical protein
MLSDKIYLNVFICSLAFGVMLMYLMGDDVKTVYVYPTMDTYKDIIIQDITHQCYQYKPKSIACPADRKKIVKIPTYE